MYNVNLNKSSLNNISLISKSPLQQKLEKVEDDESKVAKKQNQDILSLDNFNRQSEIIGQQSEEEKDKLDVTLTCMEIARRISSGDKVPPADHSYLLKHDSALYARSFMMRFPKNNPYEYKRLSKEEKQDDIAMIFNKASHELKGQIDMITSNIENAIAVIDKRV